MLMFALLAAADVRTAKASTLDANTMKVALHTNTAEENGFIDRVLALVDRHVLPLDMVDSTFLWARKKPHNKFQYFKRGLILRAQQQGIGL
jgi:hypothetical protein